MTTEKKTEEPTERTEPKSKFKGKHPVVADGCEVYFNGMKFSAGDEMRSLPENMKAELLASKRIV